MKQTVKILLYILLGLVVYTFSATAIMYAFFEWPFSEMRGYEIFPYLLHYTTEQAPWAAKGKVIGAAVTPIVIGGFGALLFIFKPREIYGDARWAELHDLKRAGLLAKEGVILGKRGSRFITSDDLSHILLVAPTRSGKGVGVIIPNCLTWQGSIVCLDVKLENFRITGGFRASYGHRVHLWSPMSTTKRSARYNPLDQVSRDPHHRISDLQIMASLLIQVSDRDPMWGQEARSLFVGAALFILEDETRPSTLGAIYRFLSSGENLKTVIKHVLDTKPDLDPTIRRSLGSFATKADKEASGVANTLIAALRIFENPVVDAATSASDFNIDDLRRHRTSIFVGVLPSQLETLGPLLRLFFQQVISVMSSRDPGPDEPHKVLMLLDEFPSIGAMDAIVSAFTLLAGYHVRVMAVIQGLSWIDKTYGRDTREGLIANCAHQIYFAPNDDTTAKHVSDALGETTKRQTSFMKSPLAISAASGTKTISVTGRPLLMPQEVRRLDSRKSIILVEGEVPVLANKIRYYANPIFKKRLMDPPEVPLLNPTVASSSSMLPKTEKEAAKELGNQTFKPKPVKDGEAWVVEEDFTEGDEEMLDMASKLFGCFENAQDNNPFFNSSGLDHLRSLVGETERA